jgi:hypothetical protein
MVKAGMNKLGNDAAAGSSRSISSRAASANNKQTMKNHQ